MATSDERKQIRKEIIDECVRHLKQAAAGFISLGNDTLVPEDREEAYSMANLYEMAADELYNLDADEVAKHKRNMKLVQEWRKRLMAGKSAPPARRQIVLDLWRSLPDHESIGSLRFTLEHGEFAEDIRALIDGKN